MNNKQHSATATAISNSNLHSHGLTQL